jgi:prolyl oligopeptidase
MNEAVAAETDDPFLWLEDVLGERALAWVHERNAASQAVLETRPEFTAIRTQLLADLNSRDRIPQVTRHGDWLYNFWQDETRPRGLWRRTTLASYRQAEPDWETVLDLEALAAAEGENWVWGGALVLGPEGRRCLLLLSRGGADAHVVREFDAVDKHFVDDGFTLPEAKSEVAWIDADTLCVGTDFGPGSMTASGYPRILKRWQRGTPLADAVMLFEADSSDVSARFAIDRTPGFERVILLRDLDFFHSERFLLEGETLRRLDIPGDASIAFMHSAGTDGDTLLMHLRSDLDVAGRRFRAGALLATDAPAWLRGVRDFQVLFEPTASRSLDGFTTTRSHVIVEVLDNVASRLEEWRRTPQGFVKRDIAAPHPGALGVTGLNDPLRSDDPLAEAYLLHSDDYLVPERLLLGHTGSDAHAQLRALAPVFDASGMRSEQLFATSADGTHVPYFVVRPATADGGPAPTLLHGYGGFEISLTPSYARKYGPAWLARGGVLVVANIRGGGEFGPAWHQAAQKQHKQRSYDDFIAVAQDLVARGITTAAQLGIEGGSNGGLMVGAVAMQRPELFRAVACAVPLLDMRRYHRLLAGASWLAEYGDPDLADEWAFISQYSPYQNVQAGHRYPAMLFTTSTRDDRVHPGHARKMAARMLSLGHEVLYFENIEGGHGGAADNTQRARMQALEFSFLWMQLRGCQATQTRAPHQRGGLTNEGRSSASLDKPGGLTQAEH